MIIDFTAAADKAIDHLNHELQNIRTGRANPAVVEELVVVTYGAPTPLLQLAAISTPEPRMIVIQPWDPGTIKDIERAISQSPLGINPVVDGKTIRLPFPAMTEERRQDMKRVVNEKAEDTKVRIRSTREEVIKHLRGQAKIGQLSEDVLEVELKKLQQQVNDRLDEVTTAIESKHRELDVI